MAARAPWIEGAVAETAQTGSAWNLLEDELLERLAQELGKHHPKHFAAVDDQQNSADLLKPLENAAKVKLSAVSSVAPSRHRYTLAQIARLAVNVQRAKGKLLAVGERNLKAQVKQNRARLQKERLHAKKEAGERLEANQLKKLEREPAVRAEIGLLEGA